MVEGGKDTALVCSFRSFSMSSSSHADSFEGRWLRVLDVPEEALESHLERARSHHAPDSSIIRRLRALALWLVDWLGPLLVLGAWRRARSLERKPFVQLLRHIREHRWIRIRVIGALLVAPLIDAIDDEKERNSPDTDDLEPPLDVSSDIEERHRDVVVIGSGVGGASVAARLARTGADTLLVERSIRSKDDDHSTETEPSRHRHGWSNALRGRPLSVTTGSALGGTDAIGWNWNERPREASLARWDRQLDTNFADGGLRPWLDDAEALLEIGTGDDRHVDPGLTRTALPTFIESGGELLAGWRVTGIRDEGEAVEVRIERDREIRELTCERLVVAAGALATPGLIRRHQLGSHWPRAGQHLRLHPSVRVFARGPDLEASSWFRDVELRHDERERLAISPIERMGRVWTSRVPLDDDGTSAWGEGGEQSIVGAEVMVRDRHTGRIRQILGQSLLSYALHPDDATDLAAGALHIGRILLEAGAERVVWPMAGEPVEWTSSDEIDECSVDSWAPEQLWVRGDHPQGTAGMGRVLDHHRRLRGSRRIHVADASVLPDSPGVPPRLTIAALSLRLGEHLASGM